MKKRKEPLDLRAFYPYRINNNKMIKESQISQGQIRTGIS